MSLWSVILGSFCQTFQQLFSLFYQTTFETNQILTLLCHLSERRGLCGQYSRG